MLRFYVIGVFSSNFLLYVFVPSSLVCGPFVNNMDICFWCQNTCFVSIVSKFDLIRSYKFRIRIIHQYVNLILAITLYSIQSCKYLACWGTTVNMKILFSVVILQLLLINSSQLHYN